VLLADIVDTSAAVAATPARSAKVAALAATLARLAPHEVVPAVAFLTGQPRQGKVGVGYQTVFGATSEIDAASAPSLTVEDVDRAVDRLQALGGPGSAAARQRELADLLGRATAAEQDLLRRLLVGELRQGALEGVMADAIAKAAKVPLAAVRRAAMLAGDLCEVAAAALAVADPDEAAAALAAIDLRVLRPVLPMLASTATSVHEAIGALGPSSVEWKLDGARIQAHRDGDEVRLFTRNLNDVTARLAGVAGVVRAFACQQVVLDGEVVGAYDEDTGPHAFQDTMSRFSRQEGSGPDELAVRFFDCLLVDGRSLIDEPLVARAAVLDALVGAWRVPSIVTDDGDEAAAFLDEALASGHEGVMVKAVASTYDAGRRGGAWRKVKPVVTLDLVVLAAEWGHGRRRGWLSNLHLGARDAEAGGFVMVGKTFKGMTDELLTWQTAQLLERETERRGIEVHVRPELVVEVAIDGVQGSPRYPGGVTLRFARVRRYRDDKAPADADTIQSLQALLHQRQT
jgi:DNA ligase-1